MPAGCVTVIVQVATPLALVVAVQLCEPSESVSDFPASAVVPASSVPVRSRWCQLTVELSAPILAVVVCRVTETG